MSADGIEDKRKFIVHEIEAWRRSKLLPEQYCDFLLNLYLEDLNDRPKGTVEAAVQKIGQASRKKWFLFFGIFTLICTVLFYFSAFPLALQIAVVGLVTTTFVAFGGIWRETRPLKALLAMSGGMLFLLGAGAAILELHGWTEGIGPTLLLAIVAAVCIACGIIVRMALVHWFGWVATVALYARLLLDRIPDPSWVETQLFWIPAALLFIWLSWFLHIRFKSVGAVMFTIGLIVWLMPELHGALLKIDPVWLQTGFVGKIVLMGVVLFRLRKQWMEWVVR